MQPKEVINRQIKNNTQLNLLYSGQELSFSFSCELKKLIKKIIAGELTASEVNELIVYASKAALSSFYQVNQYYQFDARATKELHQVYGQLLYDAKENKSLDFDRLAEKHFVQLQRWLAINQPEAHLLFQDDNPTIDRKIVCAEYGPAVQMDTLHINIKDLQEPILDIGCGRERHLVNYLQQEGLDVYGIDRDTEPAKNIERISWLNLNFPKLKWGTVISHLGFSNHFRYHHLKQNSDYLSYAAKYVEILQSLKPAGVFHYAPDLPFIEVFLDLEQYQITRSRIANTIFSSVAIQRLK